MKNETNKLQQNRRIKALEAFICIWMFVIRKSKCHTYKVKMVLKICVLGKENQKVQTLNSVKWMGGTSASSPVKIGTLLNPGSEVVVSCACHFPAHLGWSLRFYMVAHPVRKWMNECQKREELCAISKACLRVQTELSSVCDFSHVKYAIWLQHFLPIIVSELNTTCEKCLVTRDKEATKRSVVRGI